MSINTASFTIKTDNCRFLVKSTHIKMHLSYDKRDNCLEMLSTVGIYPAMANQSQLMGQSV